MSWRGLNSALRKARKAHHCVWCNELINAGDQYRYETGIFEGDFQANHWHPECHDAALADEDAIEFDPGQGVRPVLTSGSSP